MPEVNGFHNPNSRESPSSLRYGGPEGATSPDYNAPIGANEDDNARGTPESSSYQPTSPDYNAPTGVNEDDNTRGTPEDHREESLSDLPDYEEEEEVDPDPCAEIRRARDNALVRITELEREEAYLSLRTLTQQTEIYDLQEESNGLRADVRRLQDENRRLRGRFDNSDDEDDGGDDEGNDEGNDDEGDDDEGNDDEGNDDEGNDGDGDNDPCADIRRTRDEAIAERDQYNAEAGELSVRVYTQQTEIENLQEIEIGHRLNADHDRLTIQRLRDENRGLRDRLQPNGVDPCADVRRARDVAIAERDHLHRNLGHALDGIRDLEQRVRQQARLHEGRNNRARDAAIPERNHLRGNLGRALNRIQDLGRMVRQQGRLLRGRNNPRTPEPLEGRSDPPEVDGRGCRDGPPSTPTRRPSRHRNGRTVTGVAPSPPSAALQAEFAHAAPGQVAFAVPVAVQSGPGQVASTRPAGRRPQTQAASTRTTRLTATEPPPELYSPRTLARRQATAARQAAESTRAAAAKPTGVMKNSTKKGNGRKK